MRTRAFVLLLFAAFLAATSQSGLAGRGLTETPLDVAGTYSYSHAFGFTRITLAKDGSFTGDSADCTTAYNFKGSYVVKDGVVEATLESGTKSGRDGSDVETIFPEKDASGRATDKKEVARYRPVAWGERLYLLPADDLLSFCNAVNLGTEPRRNWAEEMMSGSAYFGSFYLREGDEKKSADGLPQLPERWQEYLLKKPVAGVVLSIDGDNTATISVGGREGLKEGMVLTVVGGRAPSMWSGLKVVSVGDTTAKVEIADQVVEGSKVSSRYERPKPPE
jgi:hypothetical protein